MYSSIALLEYEPTADAPDEAGARELVQGGATRVSRYQRLDGDERYESLVIAEFRDPSVAAATVAGFAAPGVRVQSYNEVFRMHRNPDRSPAQVPSSWLFDSAPEQILTVRLPVAEGRAEEWNRWYDDSHMPTVFGLAQGIEIGHRFAPSSTLADGSYFVIYEFGTREALDAWQTGSIVGGKRDEYAQMWQVENTRRAFSRQYIIEG